MDFAELQRHWDAFGRQDPFWAILARPDRRGNRWPLDEFFETGRTGIAAVMADASRHGVPRHRRRALDFGCGAGRLTQALAAHFDAALGVDVAPSMIDLARTHNRMGERCRFEVNGQADLARWADASFDLVYTGRVLQHMEPRFSTAYIRELVRVLAPGGYLSFDLPAGPGDAIAAAEGTTPPSSMRARITVDGPNASPAVMAPGSATAFHLTVTNVGPLAWRATDAHPINLGNHWLGLDGAAVAYDDGRGRMPDAVEPGSPHSVRIVVTAPVAPGTYRLQFDVVQEGVAWFAACGSEPAEITIRVDEAAASDDERGSAEGSESEPAGFEPVMEMHAVPRDEAEALIAGAGARLLEVHRVHHCGPLWTAYRYDVTKDPRRG